LFVLFAAARLTKNFIVPGGTAAGSSARHNKIPLEAPQALRNPEEE